MITWLVFAAATAGVILAIARPLAQPSEGGGGGAGEEGAYRLQLEELSRDEERGVLGREEAAQTRAEIARRLLKASKQRNLLAASAEAGGIGPNIAFFALAAVIGTGALALYDAFGSPGEPDQPLEARLNAPVERQTLGIQIANVERRLRADPKDAMGWNVLAPVYFRTEQFEKAANAYRKAIELSGENEDRLYGLFESLNFANNGTVPAGAKPILDKALAMNPKSLRGRFWLAIIADQDGRKADAGKIYRDMLSENIAPAWKTVINQRLAALNETPSSGEMSGGTGGGEQSAMIRGMVDRLAARLKENGDDLQGWLRLIKSYTVLNETSKAAEAAASARKQFAGNAEALAQIDGEAKGTGAEGAGQIAASAEAGGLAEGDQGAMIHGMVERLAARLKENGGDLQGWLRLIKSYAVLRETGKAQDAAASARRQFASEPQALEEIESLTRGLGLPAAAEQGGQPKS
jgi:cytochrome c-type biogenesis protein CcmH